MLCEVVAMLAAILMAIVMIHSILIGDGDG